MSTLAGALDAPEPAARVEQDPERLKLTELFFSLQGEANAVGWPTVFVRLTGCPLRCRWCDTSYSFQGGEWTTIDALLERIAAFGARHVCVTGGEPLAQKRCLKLLERLCDLDYSVSLETSGALDTSAVDPRVSIVLDLKAPDSGEAARNRIENLAILKPHDQVKFVLASRTDYDWAVRVIRDHALPERATVLFSPVHDELAPRTLAEWILNDRLPVRFQLQLHKILWDDARGR
jgi:7-carboxy-7-deazaguanine synthase